MMFMSSPLNCTVVDVPPSRVRLMASRQTDGQMNGSSGHMYVEEADRYLAVPILH